VPAAREVRSQRHVPVPGIGPDELDDGIGSLFALRREGFGVRRIPARLVHHDVRARPERLVSRMRHRARRRVVRLARSDEHDERDCISHRFERA
jgi:hypothetical protein